jgi:hypothetical protein
MKTETIVLIGLAAWLLFRNKGKSSVEVSNPTGSFLTAGPKLPVLTTAPVRTTIAVNEPAPGYYTPMPAMPIEQVPGYAQETPFVQVVPGYSTSDTPQYYEEPPVLYAYDPVAPTRLPYKGQAAEIGRVGRRNLGGVRVF